MTEGIFAVLYVSIMGLTRCYKTALFLHFIHTAVIACNCHKSALVPVWGLCRWFADNIHCHVAGILHEAVNCVTTSDAVHMTNGSEAHLKILIGVILEYESMIACEIVVVTVVWYIAFDAQGHWRSLEVVLCIWQYDSHCNYFCLMPFRNVPVWGFAVV